MQNSLPCTDDCWIDPRNSYLFIYFWARKRVGGCGEVEGKGKNPK